MAQDKKFFPKRFRREDTQLEARLRALEDFIANQALRVRSDDTGQVFVEGSEGQSQFEGDPGFGAGGGGTTVAPHEILNNSFHVDVNTTVTPADGYAFVYDATTGTWGPEAQSGTPTGSAGGDLSGTYPNPTVNSLQNSGVALPTAASGNERYVVGVVAGVFPLPAYYYGLFELGFNDLSDGNNVVYGTPNLTAGAESANAITVTIQLRDGAGVSLTGKRLARVWISATDKGAATGSPPNTGVSITTGTSLNVFVANADWTIISDTNSVIALSLGETTAKTFYVMCSYGGNGGVSDIGSVAATFT